MSNQDNVYICSRCGFQFEFCPQVTESIDTGSIPVTCPKCNTAYVRKVFTFPKGYSSKPHS